MRSWGIYLLSLTAWVTAVIVLAFLGYLICTSITWHDSPIYYLLLWVRDYIVFICMFVVLLGWVVISYFFIARPAQNMELLLSSTQALAYPTDTPIRLPESLKTAEGQLNLVREQALRNTRAARDAEQRKNDLVVYLAHDLKTPLTSVIGYLTLLKDEPQLTPETRSHYTDVALDKAMRLEELVNEFFDITRFSLSRLELETRDTDLHRMLEQLCSEFAPVLESRGLICQLELDEPLRAVCDSDKMARVFDNLLNNAVHYAYEGSVLHIEGHTENGRVILIFRNAGATIPPDKLGRMFEQFFRLDAARGTQTGHAGLGLAIAKEIVQAHGGTITAWSGSEQVVFTVTLPLAPEP